MGNYLQKPLSGHHCLLFPAQYVCQRAAGSDASGARFPCLAGQWREEWNSPLLGSTEDAHLGHR